MAAADLFLLRAKRMLVYLVLVGWAARLLQPHWLYSSSFLILSNQYAMLAVDALGHPSLATAHVFWFWWLAGCCCTFAHTIPATLSCSFALCLNALFMLLLLHSRHMPAERGGS